MDRDYYIFSNGRLKRKDNTLYFIDSEQNKKAIPIEQVNCVHLFGEIDINSKLLNYLPQYNIILNFYNYYGYYSGTYYPRKQNVSGFTVVWQSNHYMDHIKRMYLAQSFLDSAVHHILRNLRRYKNREGIEEIILTIEAEKGELLKAQTISELMGVEGRIRNYYYSAFNSILANEFSFKKRAN
ncbi:MAG: CRISP-associated protein Cas1 [Clostridiales bacterium]|nr:CRISP-associated protein Cas1 [Clostridiales bacterium]